MFGAKIIFMWLNCLVHLPEVLLWCMLSAADFFTAWSSLFLSDINTAGLSADLLLLHQEFHLFLVNACKSSTLAIARLVDLLELG